ncbi:AcvB/VirJ family lysyl-phosphatidylglycerol hydrolase [Agrobacterium larrymoorei]|uniref:Bacterial virulence domain-containing protein n=1 Tax=Agrobacterium larrymoorei TaxID=160699 RepID=A0A4D7DV65_9HYPH|nr:AcvB/VirJ family lysyl-phosphatidylglycerol hydrolase [Agrobacterium larrymoorei]QCJ00994.1 hypothetical protein CFBP5473_23775 [Agrobacterium larrymoorei]QYA10332.1 hypothetical protein J5285_22450 [Agrobacterium larrymoorei]
MLNWTAAALMTSVLLISTKATIAHERPSFKQSPQLPVHFLAGKPKSNTIVIFYSGDGGWGNLNEQVGANLAKQGIHVIGIDSLRYFWSQKTPEETSRDLSVLIDTYTRLTGAHNVVLAGFSFGADILPAAYNGLPKNQKAKIKGISLLALSHQVDYVVSLRGWLGLKTEGKGGDPINDLGSVNPLLVRCIYGLDDRYSSCPSLRGTAIKTVGLKGGHHLGNDYSLLAKLIIPDNPPN